MPIPNSMQEVYELAASGKLDSGAIEAHVEEQKKNAAVAAISRKQDKEAWKHDKFTKELKNMLILAWAKEDDKPGSIRLKDFVRDTLNFIND